MKTDTLNIINSLASAVNLLSGATGSGPAIAALTKEIERIAPGNEVTIQTAGENTFGLHGGQAEGGESVTEKAFREYEQKRRALVEAIEAVDLHALHLDALTQVHSAIYAHPIDLSRVIP